MPRLTYKARKRVRRSSFVFPRGTKAHPGRAMFPLTDKAHGRAALLRAVQKKVKLTERERCKVVREVCSRFPDIATCEGRTTSRKLNVCVR